jgi:IS5 family transposase
MAVRRVGQLSLADGLASRQGRSQVTLEQLSRLIDWDALARVLAPVEPSRHGAPGYPALPLLKALLLQQWYGLSDPGLEDAVADRMSFRRFVGLALDERAPDHSTIHRFRKALGEHGLTERIFSEVTRQIDAKGFILRQGTMVDATLIDAHVRRPQPPKNDAGETGAGAGTAAGAGDEPAEAIEEASPDAAPDAVAERPPSKLVSSPTDPDASWAKKGNKRTFGYKGHVGVDYGSGIIRRACFTTAAVADTTIADALILGDERAVYADKAYDTKARRRELKARGIKDRIAHRANKHHALSKRQEQRNAGISRRRSGVERIFAIGKCLMGWRRVRYIGFARNAAHFDLLCTAINLKRLAVLAT